MDKGKLLGLLIIIGLVAWSYGQINQTAAPTPAPADESTPTDEPNLILEKQPLPLADPVADWQSRITKKSFGTYVTPQNSPVSPERFTGYHTGVDVEYGDITTDVPVFAPSEAGVVLARTADGYGGVAVLSFLLDGTAYTAIYGHLRPNSLPVVGQTLTRGETFGLLGTAYSTETDGERRHLHFAIHRGTEINLRGYVPAPEALADWIDPLTLFGN